MLLVETGPCRVLDYAFPLNNNGRHFSVGFYSRKLSNGEVVDRSWLVYSKSVDRIFCFCCKMFGYTGNKFCTDGFCDWNHLSVLVKEHECSVKHMEAQYKWSELSNRSLLKQTIDKELQRVIDAEKVHWRAVLERLLAIVQFLAQRNLAFRGSCDKLAQRSNGNFLGLVETLSKFDPVMAEHVRRVKNDDIREHYLGPMMQNEFIQLISNHVQSKITSNIKAAKYFSVILDCTPDVSHVEQMTIILRHVEIVGKSVNIAEHFVGFVVVDESTGKGLTETFLSKLDVLGLKISDCRGQGYDNGSNMRGMNKGVQARILKLEPRAMYVPCSGHSLNLLLCDMAKSCTEALTFFGILQQIYVLFSASTKRWQVLKNHVKNLTVKPVCDTRWEARVNCVKAIRYQVGEVYDALVEVADTSSEPKCRTEALSLAKALKKFSFLVTLVIWYDVLVQINLACKLLQSNNIPLDEAMRILNETKQFLLKYKTTGFASAVSTAKELAEELEMSASDMKFESESSMRRRKKTIQFAYEAQDEPIVNPEDKFRISFF